jgi:hypothetical protein
VEIDRNTPELREQPPATWSNPGHIGWWGNGDTSRASLGQLSFIHDSSQDEDERGETVLRLMAAEGMRQDVKPKNLDLVAVETGCRRTGAIVTRLARCLLGQRRA